MPGRRARTRHRRGSGSLWVVAAVVLASLAGLAIGFRQFDHDGGSGRPATPGVTHAPGTLSVATWNVCGVRQWNCEDTGSAEEKRARIEALVRESGARVVLLQEMCSADLDSVRASLGGEWHSLFRPYTAVREGRRSTVRCTGDGRGTAGYGMLSGLPLTGVTDVPLPQPAIGLRRNILCATAAEEDVRICTTHLNPQQGGARAVDAGLRERQLRALAGAAAGPRTVFGGDLNTAPSGSADATAWSRVEGVFGAYQECDRPGPSGGSRNTHRSGYKIDYLFTGLERRECSVLRSPASDHWALVLRFTTG
ncbi:endonuclease/exonuclease/phosphatase family protein [Streptomyces sp. NPDC006415]|uniref:endonuclease/exonuclease/phosphatase family protein n=1 Tax=Streptomyces sp. NPDC006415 TaxID=3155351 RepID=UPI00339FF735